MILRRELSTDEDAVRALHMLAFSRPGRSGDDVPEGVLVDQLRAGDHVIPDLTFVVVDDDEVIGSVVCSWATLEPDRRQVVALGPIGVLPDRQGQGVGQALVHGTLAAADALDEPVVVLLGEPKFYGRFGFVPASDVGINSPNPEWGSYFQVRTLTTWDASIKGDFRYAAPFDSV